MIYLQKKIPGGADWVSEGVFWLALEAVHASALSLRLGCRTLRIQLDSVPCTLNRLSIVASRSLGWTGLGSIEKWWPFRPASTSKSLVATCPENKRTLQPGQFCWSSIASSIPFICGIWTSVSNRLGE